MYHGMLYDTKYSFNQLADYVCSCNVFRFEPILDIKQVEPKRHLCNGRTDAGARLCRVGQPLRLICPQREIVGIGHRKCSAR